MQDIQQEATAAPRPEESQQPFFILYLSGPEYTEELRRLTYWVESLLLPVYGAEVTSNAPWCPQWHKHAEAIADAKKALEINPRNEQAMYALARVYAAAGEAKLAMEQLSHAIARQPRQWKAEASNDAAFEKLRALPEFQRLIKP